MKNLLIISFFTLNLIGGNIIAQTYISGNQTGILDTFDSPYYVIGDIHVPSGNSLRILPGVEFVFVGHYKFCVDSNAILKAIGTETDSIFFSAVDTILTSSSGGHHSIRFFYSAVGCTISYCQIKYGNAIGSTTGDYYGGGIYCYYSSPTIKNNNIIGNSANRGGGICCRYFSSPKIINNTISNNLGGGIYCTGTSGGLRGGSNPNIKNNIISGNSNTASGGGIWCEYGSNPNITNNIIMENSSDYSGGGIECFHYANPKIINNTIISNSASWYGGGINCLDSNPIIFNSIFWNNEASVRGNEIYLRYASENSCTVFVAHSNVNTSECHIETGSTIIWGIGNINENPRFMDPLLHLSELSSCIDAGAELVYVSYLDIIIWAPVTDFDGETRPHGEGFDIGADEAVFFTCLELTPLTIAISCTVGVSHEDTIFSIIDCGTDTLLWDITESCEWFACSPMNGIGDDNITITFTTEALTPGNYTDTIIVAATDAIGSPAYVEINLTVIEEPPCLNVDPLLFEYEIYQGNSLIDSSIIIFNSGGGSLNWLLSETSTWFSCFPMLGTGNDTVLISYATDTLDIGNYNDTLTISAMGAVGSPALIPFTLSVIEEPSPCLAVMPGSIAISCTVGAIYPNSSLIIEDTCGFNMNWEISSSCEELFSYYPDSGIGQDTVTIEIIEMLGVGEYSCSLFVTAPGALGSPAFIPFHITIEDSFVPSPCLSVSPLIFDLSMNPDDETLDTNFTIIDTCFVGLIWSITESTPWMWVDTPLSGSGDVEKTLHISPSGLDTGIYIDTVKVEAFEAIGSPANIEIILRIREPEIPCLSLLPETLYFGFCTGDTIDTLQISFCSGTTAVWCIEESEDWLEIRGGTLCDDIETTRELIVHSSLLSPGTYSTSITASFPGSFGNYDTTTIIFNADNPCNLCAEPDSIYFEYYIDEIPEDETLFVYNSGGCSEFFEWELSISGSFECFPLIGEDSVMITVSPTSGLSSGSYFGEIAFDLGDTVELIAEVLELPIPILFVEQETLYFIAVVGEETERDTFIISNIGDGSMNWTIDVVGPDSWISYSPLYGLNDDTVEVWVNPSGLSIGNYNTSLRVDAEDTEDSPQFVNVQLEIIPDTSDIKETINKPDNFYLEVFPNPFNSSCRIITNSKKSGKLEILNLRGELVDVFDVSPGLNELLWDPDGITSGIYFIKFECEKNNVLKKVLLLK